MLTLARDPSFSADVSAQQPTPEGPREVTFAVRFKAVQFAEMEAYGRSGEETARFLQDVLLGADVGDEDGTILPWSDALRDRLIDTPWLRAPLMTAYRTNITGAARGN